ncbi:MAG: DUF4870 domain-containing protein [Phycisphaerales bacterium]|nr:DUF4870 domain-containing protein [Phycisphaerales bacterium]MCI0630589.1 DUF4870 domain-containing protein [Phycisphaerales bacterium]MCI0675292.1 DUF4870 domain-containing protein [Phycisphaerales bacterium]
MAVANPTVEPNTAVSNNGAGASQGSNGRLRDSGLSDADRHFGVAMHLSPFSFVIVGPLAFLAPLILWLIRKDTSTFNDDHGRELMNVLLTALAVCGGGFIAGFLTFGLAWLAAAVWLIVNTINLIRGAVAAGNGEYFRYPMTIRFIT